MLILLISLVFATEVHGHRGARAIYPENTLAAIEYALQNNVDYIEIDLHMTRDGNLVVHHDAIVNRDLCVYKNGKEIRDRYIIFQLNLKEIKQFDCGLKTDPSFPEQTSVPGSEIPTLEEVIALFLDYKYQGSTSKLNIEIKHENNRQKYPDVYIYSQILSFVLDQYLYIDDFMIQSFSKDFMLELEHNRPNYYSSYLSVFSSSSALKMLDKGIDALSVRYSFVSSNFVKKVHSKRKRVLVWTVNKEKNWDRMLNKQVDGIITDDPASLMDYLN